MPKHELADGWPHKHHLENPGDISITPRTAYFVENGKLMFLPLEELDVDKIKYGYTQLAAEGVEV